MPSFEILLQLRAEALEIALSPFPFIDFVSLGYVVVVVFVDVVVIGRTKEQERQ